MTTINKNLFFNNYPFTLTDKLKESITYLLDKFDASEKLTRLSWAAYILATAKLETAETFEPVIEGYYIKTNRKQALYNYYSKYNKPALKTIFPNSMSGISFEGRGYVQLTHNFNYEKFVPLIQKVYPDIDIFNNPDEVMTKDISWIVLEEGMTRDDVTVKDINFTGHTLEMYLNDNKLDWVGARKIINGTNEDHLIGSWAEQYYSALEYNEEEKPIVPEVISADVEIAQAQAINGINIDTNGIPYAATISLT